MNIHLFQALNLLKNARYKTRKQSITNAFCDCGERLKSLTLKNIPIFVMDE